ncbi:MAG: hypothetical protein LBC65_02650 [Oscillospiraceae bacterium]|nr:hypothetical protein [Oscillospiraceae bacterium]
MASEFSVLYDLRARRSRASPLEAHGIRTPEHAGRDEDAALIVDRHQGGR